MLVFGWLKLLAASVAQPWKLHPAYLGIAALGMVAGALAAGTGNLLLSGFDEVGKRASSVALPAPSSRSRS